MFSVSLHLDGCSIKNISYFLTACRPNFDGPPQNSHHYIKYIFLAVVADLKRLTEDYVLLQKCFHQISEKKTVTLW